jgi:hypothetical protein
MENRLKIIIICSLFLAFLAIAEGVFAQGEVDTQNEYNFFSEEERQDLWESEEGRDLQAQYDQLNAKKTELWQQYFNGQVSNIDQWAAELKEVENELDEVNQKIVLFNYYGTTDPQEAKNRAGSFGGFFFDLFTINIPGSPAEITLFLTIVNSVLIAIVGFLIASFVYDAIKAAPFT